MSGVEIIEPYLSAHSVEGAKIRIAADIDALNSERARRLAAALERAAEKVDEVDRACLPHLLAYRHELDRLSDDEELEP